jgi:hypothetical protein
MRWTAGDRGQKTDGERSDESPVTDEVRDYGGVRLTEELVDSRHAKR